MSFASGSAAARAKSVMSLNRKMTLAALLLLLTLTIWLWPAGEELQGKNEAVAGETVARGATNHQRAAFDKPGANKKGNRADIPKDRFQEIAKRMNGGSERVSLTSQQIEAYLTKENRSRGALLAAYQMSHDQAYLEEVLKKFPNDPQVLLIIARNENDPAKRLTIYDQMKSVDAGNGLPDLMAAKALFDLGKNDEALARVGQAATNPFNHFVQSSLQNTQEAFASAGYSVTEAKLLAFSSQDIPDLFQSTKVANKLREMKLAYIEAGDEASATQVDSTLLALARQHGQSATVVDQVIGFAYERSIIEDDESEEANQARADFDRRRDAIFNPALKVVAMMSSNAVSESDWGNYFDRLKALGEISANQWLLEKYPQP